MNISALLLALKLGVFLPAQDAPFKGWFYVTTNVVSRPTWAIEAGISPEMIKRANNFKVNGKSGERYTWHTSYMFNVVKVINDDCDLGMGARYRTYGKHWYPHLSLSFKFSSLKKEYENDLPANPADYSTERMR